MLLLLLLAGRLLGCSHHEANQATAIFDECCRRRNVGESELVLAMIGADADVMEDIISCQNHGRWRDQFQRCVMCGSLKEWRGNDSLWSEVGLALLKNVL